MNFILEVEWEPCNVFNWWSSVCGLLLHNVLVVLFLFITLWFCILLFVFYITGL